MNENDVQELLEMAEVERRLGSAAHERILGRIQSILVDGAPVDTVEAEVIELEPPATRAPQRRRWLWLAAAAVVVVVAGGVALLVDGRQSVDSALAAPPFPISNQQEWSWDYTVDADQGTFSDRLSMRVDDVTPGAAETDASVRLRRDGLDPALGTAPLAVRTGTVVLPAALVDPTGPWVGCVDVSGVDVGLSVGGVAQAIELTCEGSTVSGRVEQTAARRSDGPADSDELVVTYDLTWSIGDRAGVVELTLVEGVGLTAITVQPEGEPQTTFDLIEEAT